jgi:hypothetical protein
MCEILGLQSSWIVIAGLALDLIGVAILAIDLLPEYWARSRLRSLRRQLDALKARSRVRLPVHPPIEPEDDVERRLNELALAAAENRRAIDELRLRIVQHDLAEIGVNPRALRASDGTLERQAVAAVLADAHAALEDRVRFNNRWRSPIGLGIAAILIGFLLQIIGTWPC